MGGNAIPNCERFNNDEMDLFRDVFEMFFVNSGISLNDFRFVESYGNKLDHGDIDILVSNKISKELFEHQIVDWFTPVAKIIKNGSVWSVGVELFIDHSGYDYSKIIQVDFIFTDNLEISGVYFDWNDLGNLMGRVSHKMGFKYGHEGLKYVFRDGTHQYAEVVVSQDPETIFKFLGFDYQRYLKGFNTLEDIFEFVTDCHYFNPDIYLLDNLNHVSRIRDRKRKTYMEFLQWCKDRDWQWWPIYDWSRCVKEINHLAGLYRSFEFFPEWCDVYTTKRLKYEKHLAFKEWWNGDKALEITGLKGKELGGFMKAMKDVYNLEKCFDMGIDSEQLARMLWENF